MAYEGNGVRYMLKKRIIDYKSIDPKMIELIIEDLKDILYNVHEMQHDLNLSKVDVNHIKDHHAAYISSEIKSSISDLNKFKSNLEDYLENVAE